VVEPVVVFAPRLAERDVHHGSAHCGVPPVRGPPVS
jgi:hypothetical protein